MTRDNPGIPRFIHRRKSFLSARKMVASRMLDLLLPVFPARRQSAPACWRFAQRHRVEVFRYTSVVERVVVDYYIDQRASASIRTIVIILSSLSFIFVLQRLPQCEVAVTTSTGEAPSS